MKWLWFVCEIYEYTYHFLIYCDDEEDMRKLKEQIEKTEFLDKDYGTNENYNCIKQKIESLFKKEVICLAELDQIKYGKYRSFNDRYC